MIKFNRFTILLLITVLQRKLLKSAGIFPAVSKVSLGFSLSINGLVHWSIKYYKMNISGLFSNKNVMEQKSNWCYPWNSTCKCHLEIPIEAMFCKKAWWHKHSTIHLPVSKNQGMKETGFLKLYIFFIFLQKLFCGLVMLR